MHRRNAACLLLVTASVCAVATAENWPQWRGPRGDGIVKGARILQSWPEDGPKELWRIEMGAGYSSPVAVDGVIYMFAQEGQTDVLTALRADDGRELWKKGYPTRFRDRRYPGTRATPTVETERVYTMGGAGDLTCWDRATGSIVWSVNVLEKTGARGITWGSACSPLVIGSTIYVQAGRGGATAVAVDKATGEFRWSSESQSIAGYATIAQTKANDRDTLLVFGGVDMLGMDQATGRTLWSLPYETEYNVNAATPLVRDGQVFITHGYRPGKGAMLKLAPDSVEKVWEDDVIRSRYRTPILEGEVMYVNTRGTLKCVRWADGTQVWVCDDSRMGLGIGGSHVRVDDLIITLSETGTLSLVHATPEGWQLRSQVKLLDQRNVWSTPLVYNNRLYVKGNDELICLDIAAPEVE